jgi:hypothetical protein
MREEMAKTVDDMGVLKFPTREARQCASVADFWSSFQRSLCKRQHSLCNMDLDVIKGRLRQDVLLFILDDIDEWSGTNDANEDQSPAFAEWLLQLVKAATKSRFIFVSRDEVSDHIFTNCCNYRLQIDVLSDEDMARLLNRLLRDVRVVTQDELNGPEFSPYLDNETMYSGMHQKAIVSSKIPANHK